MKNKSVYLIYSHEYNTAYVGKSCNLKKRFYQHCGDNRSSVKQFCNNQKIKVRGTFNIYEITQCSKAEAAYYEGHIYDLIKAYFPRINLINKYKPNRSREEWVNKHAERVKSVNRTWREANKDHLKDYYKEWMNKHAERYHKNYYVKNRERAIYISKKWRENNLEYDRCRCKKWRDEHPDYYKEYYKNKKQRNK